MEEMTNNQKKPNIFKRFGTWYKKKYEEHPVATIAVTAGIGTAVVGGVGYAVYKIATRNNGITVIDDAIKLTGADTNAEALANGLAGVEPDTFDLPSYIPEFDRMKVVNEAGEVLGDVIDCGDNWIGMAPIEKAAEAVEEVVETVTDTAI